MFRASLCPSSGDRLYKTTSGVSLDVLAADCVESGHELSAQCTQLVSWLHTIRSQHIQAKPRCGFIQSVSWRWALWCPKHVEL